MFLPDNLKDQSQKDREQRTKKAFAQIEQWATELIPPSARDGVQFSVQEFECNSDGCSPVDTAIAITFPRGGRGMVGIPMEAADVKIEHLKACFPPEDILIKWSRGEDAEWPPLDYDDDDVDVEFPELRFEVDQIVECRVGPDPVTGWGKGKIIQLWYREPGWPPNSYAPYKVKLDNGTDIFAPADQDRVIRAAK